MTASASISSNRCNGFLDKFRRLVVGCRSFEATGKLEKDVSRRPNVISTFLALPRSVSSHARVVRILDAAYFQKDGSTALSEKKHRLEGRGPIHIKLTAVPRARGGHRKP